MTKHFSKTTLRLLLTGLILSSVTASEAGAMFNDQQKGSNGQAEDSRRKSTHSGFKGMWQNVFENTWRALRNSGDTPGEVKRAIRELDRFAEGMRERIRGKLRPDEDVVLYTAGVEDEINRERSNAASSSTSPQTSEHRPYSDEEIQRALEAFRAFRAQQQGASSGASSSSGQLVPPAPQPAVIDTGTPVGGLLLAPPQPRLQDQEGGLFQGLREAQGDGFNDDELMAAVLASLADQEALPQAPGSVVSTPEASSSSMPGSVHVTPGWTPLSVSETFDRTAFVNTGREVPLVVSPSEEGIFAVRVPDPLEKVQDYTGVLLPGEATPRFILDAFQDGKGGITQLHLSGSPVALEDGAVVSLGRLPETLDYTPLDFPRNWRFGFRGDGRIMFVRNTELNRRFLTEEKGLVFANGHRSLIDRVENGGRILHVFLNNPMNVSTLGDLLVYNVYQGSGPEESLPDFDGALAYGASPAYVGRAEDQRDTSRESKIPMGYRNPSDFQVHPTFTRKVAEGAVTPQEGLETEPTSQRGRTSPARQVGGSNAKPEAMEPFNG